MARASGFGPEGESSILSTPAIKEGSLRVLVTGATGLLGRFIIQKFHGDHQLFGTYRSRKKGIFPDDSFNRFCPSDVLMYDWDLRNFQVGVSVFNLARPDVVIHCASSTDVDACESSPHHMENNCVSTMNISLLCDIFNCRLVFMSTDLVFGDDCKRPRYEHDTPNPIQDYGKSKLFGEHIVHSIVPWDRVVVVRTSWLYGWEHFGIRERDFPQRIAASLREGNRNFFYNEQVSVPTHAGILASALKELIQNPEKCRSTYHITCRGHTSRENWIRTIADKYADVVFMREYTAVQGKANRPAFSALNSGKFQIEFFTNLPHWREELINYVYMIKSNDETP